MEVAHEAGMEVDRFNDAPEAIVQHPPHSSNYASQGYQHQGYGSSTSLPEYHRKEDRLYDGNEPLAGSSTVRAKKSRPRWWIIILVIVIVIIAAVGGGIAGALSNKKKSPKTTYVLVPLITLGLNIVEHSSNTSAAILQTTIGLLPKRHQPSARRLPLPPPKAHATAPSAHACFPP